MANLRDELQSAFEEAFPKGSPMIRADAFSAVTGREMFGRIELDRVEDVGNGRYAFTLSLVICEDTSIYQVAQQELRPNLSKLVSDPQRTAAFARAHAAVVAQVLASYAELARLMPIDLVTFGPLLLAKSNTEDDFAKALAVKSRLGKYLPTAQA